MSETVKGLKEKLAVAKQEMQDMFAVTETENRGFNEAEKLAFDEKTKEVRSLVGTINAKQEMGNLGMVEEVAVTEELSQEVKEERAFTQFLQGKEGEEFRSVITSAEPGKLMIPTTIESGVIELLGETAPLFSASRNYPSTTGLLEILRETDLGTAGFIGELTDATPNDFKMDKVTLRQHRAVTAIQLSQHMLNDSAIPLASYSTELLGRRLGTLLDEAVLTGGGKDADSFEGILKSTKIEKHEAEGAETTVRDYQKAMLSLHPAYVAGAVWVMSRKEFMHVGTLQDGNGHPYLAMDVAKGPQAYTLFGLPVLISDVMAKEENIIALLANMKDGYATMTKKGLELKHVSADTTQALKGGHLFLLDGYFDGIILNEKAMRFLTKKG